MAEAQKVVNLSTPSIDLPTRQNFEALTDQGNVRAVLSALAVLDFGSIAANLAADLTVTVAGARGADICMVAPPFDIDAELQFTAHVTADDTVTVRAANNSLGAVNPAAGAYRVMVFNFSE